MVFKVCGLGVKMSYSNVRVIRKLYLNLEEKIIFFLNYFMMKFSDNRFYIIFLDSYV